MESPRWTDKIGGRKFIVAMTALVLIVFAVDVSGEMKLSFAGTIVGLFSAVNAASKGRSSGE